MSRGGSEVTDQLTEAQLLTDLENWFHRLGSDDPKWWAKEIHAYLVGGDPLRESHLSCSTITDEQVEAITRMWWDENDALDEYEALDSDGKANAHADIEMVLEFAARVKGEKDV